MDFKSFKIDPELSTLIIAPRTYHLMILESIDALDYLWNVDLMTRDEFISNHVYTADRYSKSAVFDTFKLMPHVAEACFKLVPWADKTETMPAPFNEVLTYMKNEGLIQKTPWAHRPLKQQVVFWGYAYQTFLETEILTTIYQKTPIIHVPQPQAMHAIPLMEYSQEYDEVVGLAEHISQIIQTANVEPGQIKVHMGSETYESLIDLIFPRYNIPYHIFKGIPLWELPISVELMDALSQDEKSISAIVGDFYERLTMMAEHPQKHQIIYEFSNVLEPFVRSDSPPSKLKPMIEHALKKKTLMTQRAENMVEINDTPEIYIHEADLLFICGANEGEFPPKVSTASIIENDLRQAIKMEAVTDLSNQATAAARAMLLHPALVHVSYSHKSYTGEKIMAGLVHEYLATGRLKRTQEIQSDVSYSYVNDLIEVGKRIDAMLHYSYDDPSVNQILHSLKMHDYNYPEPFTHKSPYISKSLMARLIPEKTHTSYSKMEDYYKCEFRYLIKRLLNVKEADSNYFSQFMGSFIHDVLAQIETLPSDTEERYSVYEALRQKQIKKTPTFSAEDDFYSRQAFATLDAFVESVQAFHNTSEFQVYALEKSYEHPLNGEKIQSIKGIVDKILSYDDHFAVFDYKSSNRDLNLSILEKGLNSQLPFYMSVIESSTDPLKVPVGLFYHPFTMNTYDLQPNKSLAQQRENDWKIRGYVDQNWVPHLDPNYQIKSYFEHLTYLKSNKFSTRAKFLTSEELSLVGNFLMDKVNESVLRIESGRFLINPKGPSLALTPSCKHCEFKDICYRTPKDLEPFTYESPKAFIRHLKGDSDATS